MLSGDVDRLVSFTWGAGSDPLITGNTVLRQVYYVNVTQPTTGLRTGPGLYPDPLVPKEFGAQLQVPAQTTSFYVLTHVPPGTPAGDDSASLVVQDGVELHEVPFTLHVWRFGWGAADHTHRLLREHQQSRAQPRRLRPGLERRGGSPKGRAGDVRHAGAARHQLARSPRAADARARRELRRRRVRARPGAVPRRRRPRSHGHADPVGQVLAVELRQRLQPLEPAAHDVPH